MIGGIFNMGLDPQIYDFVTILADAERLKIAGLLARDGHRLAQIAAELDLPQENVQQHLERLIEAGLVRSFNTPGGQIFRFDRKHAESLARAGLVLPDQKELPGSQVLSQEERKLIAGHLRRDGRLESIPTQSKKTQVVCKAAITLFEQKRIYTEKEVNELLKQIHEDTATLRRNLVDGGLLYRERNGSTYWLPGEAADDK
jgi:hypothetical protein